MTDEKELELHLRNLAESIVPSTHIEIGSTKISPTGEEYISFGLLYNGKAELLRAWKKWIEAYVRVVSYMKLEGEGVVKYGSPPITTLYWRMLPEIGVDEESDSKSMTARLLISAKEEDNQ